MIYLQSFFFSRNTLKIERLRRTDHGANLQCQGNNNNKTKDVGSQIKIDLLGMRILNLRILLLIYDLNYNYTIIKDKHYIDKIFRYLFQWDL